MLTPSPVADERANGPTFALADVCFIDFETRSSVDIRQAGAVRYATQADAIILTYAIGSAPVRTIAVRDFSRPLDLVDLPTGLLAFHAKVMNGTGVYAAWNAGFDRAVWNFSTLGFPELKPHQIIDVMAQGAASGLPADLSAAAKDGLQAKDKEGRKLIKLFCLPGSTATPQTNPEQWRAFLGYAAQDVEAMRAVFLQTRQLTLAEWREYWAMEAINDRGAAIDLKLVERAAALAAEDKVRSKAELRAITGDPKMTVDISNGRFGMHRARAAAAPVRRQQDPGQVRQDAGVPRRRRPLRPVRIQWCIANRARVEPRRPGA
jgi:DNA polymerase